MSALTVDALPPRTCSEGLESAITDIDANGPYRTLASQLDAALQLPRSGHWLRCAAIFRCRGLLCGTFLPFILADFGSPWDLGSFAGARSGMTAKPSASLRLRGGGLGIVLGLFGVRCGRGTGSTMGWVPGSIWTGSIVAPVSVSGSRVSSSIATLASIIW